MTQPDCNETKIQLGSINVVLSQWGKSRADKAVFEDGLVHIFGFNQKKNDRYSFVTKLHLYKSYISGFSFVDCKINGSWLNNLNQFDRANRFIFTNTIISGNNAPLAHMTDLSLIHMPGSQVVELLKGASSQLKKLRIEWVNIIPALQEQINSMSELTDLVIKSVETSGGFGSNQKLRSLELEQIGLCSEFIDWLYKLRGLESIRISEIQLDKPLPVSLLATAKRIHLSYCNLPELMPCICPELTEFTISNVPFKAIPKEYIGSKLTKLVIQNTQIEEVINIENLPNLTELRLSNNLCLKKLPNAISCMEKLTTLEISSLTLPGLPSWLTQAIQLKQLDLSGCTLGTLSEGVGLFLAKHFRIVEQFSSEGPEHQLVLKRLSIDDMDARFLTISTKPEEFLKYYYAQPRKVAHEIKLFVLGSNAALSQRTVESILAEPDITAEATSVRGVRMMELRKHDFKRLRRTIQFDSDVFLHVHEMSDRPAHALAHPLFFSDSSLYLVILDAAGKARIQQEMQYWLTLVESRCTNGHIVFCIATERQDGHILASGAVPPACLQRTSLTYDFCSINVEDESELAPHGLLTVLIRGVSKVKSYNWKVPEQWIRIKKHLRSLFRELDVLNQARLKGTIEFYHEKDGEKAEGEKKYLSKEVLQAIGRWLHEVGAMEYQFAEDDHEQPHYAFSSRWFASCLFGVLDYAERLGGTVSAKSINLQAMEDGDDIMSANLISSRAEQVFGRLVKAGLCLNMELKNTYEKKLPFYFPMVASLLEPRYHTTNGPAQGNHIQNAMTELMKMEPGRSSHYLVSCPIVSAGLLSSLLTQAYVACRSSHEYQFTILLGHEGLFAWSSSQSDLPDTTSHRIAIVGATGSPGEIHVFIAAPDNGPGGPSGANQRLCLAKIVLGCLKETLDNVILSPGMRKEFRVFFENKQGDEYFYVPLDEIRAYNDARRTDYYYTWLKSLLNVDSLYQAYDPQSLEKKSRD